jgi:hypothetical protein
MAGGKDFSSLEFIKDGFYYLKEDQIIEVLQRAIKEHIRTYFKDAVKFLKHSDQALGELQYFIDGLMNTFNQYRELTVRKAGQDFDDYYEMNVQGELEEEKDTFISNSSTLCSDIKEALKEVDRIKGEFDMILDGIFTDANLDYDQKYMKLGSRKVIEY